MKSMTAFSSQNISGQYGIISLEIRTVNHRYLDMNIKIADELRFFETQVRKLINAQLKRGRVDLTIKYIPSIANNMDVDAFIIDKLINYQELLVKKNQNLRRLSVAEILQWPGVLESDNQNEEQITRILTDLTETALSQVQAHRAIEGEKTKAILLEKLAQIETELEDVTKILPDVVDDFRKRFTEKLKSIDTDIDEYRLEQEVVFFLAKQDVAEEIDRIKVHLHAALKACKLDEPVGRRLDFLMQELHREVNTLTSKSMDVRLNNAAIQMKVLLEQMREQIQNIE